MATGWSGLLKTNETDVKLADMKESLGTRRNRCPICGNAPVTPDLIRGPEPGFQR